MKTTNILITVIVLCASNMHSFASAKSNDHSNTIETNKNNIASLSLKYGRNRILESTSDHNDLQFTYKPTNKAQSKIILPKGRNAEVINALVTMK